MRTFASDNAAPAHPDVLRALCNANEGHAGAYGDDDWTRRAIKRFRELFGTKTDVYFTYNGTGANVTALASLLKPFEAVLCSSSAHLHTDECGALERFAGSKVLPVVTRDGKLRPDALLPFVRGPREEHHVRPRVISISQSTELGGVYTHNEVKALAAFAHDHALVLHMDGARIANAAIALDSTLRKATVDAGVDVLTFGGTKNGLLFGEAILFFDPELHQDSARYVRKQAMQLASKMRYVSAQFLALLADDLWARNARHANAMAKLLEQKVAEIPSVRITRPVESNAVFVTLPRDAIADLQREFSFYVFDESEPEVRWMTSFDTSEQDVLAFAELVERQLRAA